MLFSTVCNFVINICETANSNSIRLLSVSQLSAST